MTTLTRYKLLSGALATILAWSWLGAGATVDVSKREPSTRVALARSLRVSRGTLGVSAEEVVRRLFQARSANEVRELAKTLGVVGDDRAIDAVLPLVADVRPGVPEAILGAFGVIGTDHAIDVLVTHTKDARRTVRVAAIEALGASRHSRVEALLVELALRSGAVTQSAAIDALAALGSDGAVATLRQIAETHGEDIARYAIAALARIESIASLAALRELIDSPSVKIAQTALGAITVIDDELRATLVAIVRGTDRTLVVPALEALGRAGEAALPALREVARNAAPGERRIAIAALVQIESPEVIGILRELAATEEGDVSQAVVEGLAGLATDEARDVLIEVALSEREPAGRATSALLGMTGSEVEAALLEIAQAKPDARLEVLAHLVSLGSTDGIALAQQFARVGSDEERLDAMRVFADAGTDEARATLIDLVRAEHGDLKAEALSVLARSSPGDSDVLGVLRDALHAGSSDEAVAAVQVLSNAGTGEARDTLVEALRSSDASVAAAAVEAMAGYRSSEAVEAALRTAAERHPDLDHRVMQRLVASGSRAGFELAEVALNGADGTYSARTALQALEAAGSTQAFDLIARTTQSSNPDIRGFALQSIASTGDKRATDLATRALRDDDASVRETAAYALGTIRSDKSRDALIGLTQAGDPLDRRNAVANLARFENDRASEHLIELVRDRDPGVALSAINAVSHRADAHDTLVSVLRSSAAMDIRRHVARTLRYQGNLDDATAAFAESIENAPYE